MKISVSNKKLVALVLVALFAGSNSAALACDKAHGDCIQEARYATIEECNKAIAADNKNVHAYIDRAVLNARLGNDAEAAADFDKAAEILPLQ